MHDHGGRGGPARPPRRRWRPYLAALVAVLALALAIAACSGGGGSDQATSTTSPGGSDSTQADLAFARCMRQHGVNMPDPKVEANGRTVWQLPEGVGPDDPKVKAAQQACRQYRAGGEARRRPNPQQQQEMVAFARCMRQHGINLPDPKPDGSLPGRGSGVNPDDPKFKAAERACPGFRPKY